MNIFCPIYYRPVLEGVSTFIESYKDGRQTIKDKLLHSWFWSRDEDEMNRNIIAKVLKTKITHTATAKKNVCMLTEF